MKYEIKNLVLVVALSAMAVAITPLLAEEEIADAITDVNSDAITATDIGAVDASLVNNASAEATENIATTGTLIEIGNTTAEETTIVVRTTDATGQTEDVTLEVPTANTTLTTDANVKADLSDWISGDQVTFTAKKFLNSGALQAKKITNRSFKKGEKGVNGWVKEIRADKNEIDVTWGKNIYTLNLAEAKIVAGAKNPATINDLLVGDRVRVRVIDDKDGNPATWKAKIVVVLRRGNDLFMRVTRWVIPAKITSIPTDLTLPTIIEAEILPSKFYQKGDANNLVGAPGDKIYINIDNNTQLARRFLGKSLLSEMSVDDTIRVIGRRDETTGYINAKFIKNESIQVLGVAQRLGQITAIDATAKTATITILPEKANRETVLLKTTDKTKILRNNEKAGISDLVVGDIIKTRGVYNRNQRSVESKIINVVSQTKIETIKEKIQTLRNKIKDLKQK
ncbi:hypothetical protein KKH16_00180 [Patescibacteria group bacterium]|nr:hypothetical protein [Patescibacteria group bacterium]MBU1870580.1 hypothetical protein [Patescibacteria group bacterium]